MKLPTKFIIKTIPHKLQRYNTVGDYKSPRRNTLTITVSDLKNPKYSFLIALHELIEAFLAFSRGITEKEITKFDIESKLNDPGESEKAPYHKEHMFATEIEAMMSRELKVIWPEYEEAINKLYDS